MKILTKTLKRQIFAKFNIPVFPICNTYFIIQCETFEMKKILKTEGTVEIGRIIAVKCEVSV